MVSTEQLEQVKLDLTEKQSGLEDEMELRSTKLEGDILRLRQALQMQGPGEEEDNMDILIDSHMRDITSDHRPQMMPAGLEGSNKHFGDLSNHELHQIKKMHEKDHQMKPKTILDESLGDIMNKLVNFLTYSFDGYSKAYYKAELMEEVYDNDKTMYEKIKVFLLAFILFIKDDSNILYLGIILVFISIIIYFVNITTS